MVSPRHVQRERHLRAIWYAVVSFAIASFAYSFLHFEATQAMGFAVSSFVMLNLLNFRTMFKPIPREQVKQPSVENE